ncbi:ATP-binding protein [Marinoscillum sp. MHG1-6]|uniref:ATP-binding protein n=1 Tax=Marinoscillum sp. MHG1-6 TaxID=2959627 RepID=UPI0021587BE9|nr:ATP-binding protein [Marinoscillum sp. MHG1-6]
MRLSLLSIIISFLILSNCQPKQQESLDTTTPSLSKLWETDTLLQTPESVIFNPTDSLLYISCINGVPSGKKDGDGYIAKISAKDGSMVQLNWATGLHAPKGMGIYDGMLYVADIDSVVVISLASGEIVKGYWVEGADFLNDIDISDSGEVYISDSGTDKVHLLLGDSVTTMLESSDFGRPNGLLHLGDKMMMATSGSGNFYTINTTDWTYNILTDSLFSGDGVKQIGDDFIVSCWKGEIYYVAANGEKTLLLNTEEAFNTADIELLPESKTVFVPTFFGNQVIAYQLKN